MNVQACAEELALVTGGAAAPIERIIRKYINEGLRQADATLANTAACRFSTAVTKIRSASDDMYRTVLVADLVRGLDMASGVDLTAAGVALNTPRKGSGFALESDELYRPRLIVAARAL